MQVFEREAVIEAKPGEVWSVLTDLDAFAAVMPDVVATEMLTDGALGKGSRWRETRRFKLMGVVPIKASAVIEVSAFEKHKRFTTVSQDDAMWAQYDFTLARAGKGQTRVCLTGSLEARGKHAGNEKKERQLAAWCEKADGKLLLRLKAHVEGYAGLSRPGR